MPEAVTTWRESLWIGASSSSLSEVPWVVSSPEIAGSPPVLDATSTDSDAVVHVAGLPDYSGDLVWELNSQSWSNATGNLRALLALDGQEVAVERRMPLAGAVVSLSGVLSVAMQGSEANGLTRLAIRVTPSASFSVGVLSLSGYALAYRSSSYADGSLVSLDPLTEQTTLYEEGAIGSVLPLRGLDYLSERYGSTVSAPEGYAFAGWCDDPYGEGVRYSVGQSIDTTGGSICLYPMLEASE